VAHVKLKKKKTIERGTIVTHKNSQNINYSQGCWGFKNCLDPMWEDLLLEYNIIISLPCRKVFSGIIPVDYISKFPFIILYVRKNKFWD
jgi:hypothetical protein